LRKRKACRARRNQRPEQHHVKPYLEATAPNQILTWDITWLPTLSRGVYLNLYVILDLFSRYVVGRMGSRKENAGLAPPAVSGTSSMPANGAKSSFRPIRKA
jgi:putative transposase